MSILERKKVQWTRWYLLKCKRKLLSNCQYILFGNFESARCECWMLKVDIAITKHGFEYYCKVRQNKDLLKKKKKIRRRICLFYCVCVHFHTYWLALFPSEEIPNPIYSIQRAKCSFQKVRITVISILYGQRNLEECLIYR